MVISFLLPVSIKIVIVISFSFLALPKIVRVTSLLIFEKSSRFLDFVTGRLLMDGVRL
jgi:hypothetical protein